MKKQADLGEVLREELQKRWSLRQEDLGAEAHLSKKGMVFDTEAYTVEGLGHLCVLRMKAILGLMKMETVVLSSFQRDMPLFNLDWVGVMGKETQIAELYDTQLQPFPDEAQAAFQKLRDRDRDLLDYASGKEHWYDAILYPCSYHKTGKGVSQRLSDAARDYIRCFAEQMESAPLCDAEEKKAKVRNFAETLAREGGPAVDQMTRLFGRETAEKLILHAMYGV